MGLARDGRFAYGPGHRFAVRSDPHHGIMAGRSEDAQWLLSDQQRGILAIRFDQSGNLVDSLLFGGNQPNPRRERLERWKAEVGFTDGPIHIREFSVEPYGIGIAALPSGMQEAVDAPETFDEEELEMVLEDALAWIKDGQFVLNWGDQYYMDKDGNVVSS